MKKKLLVRPVDGRLMPLRQYPQRFITEEREVEDHPYYRRAILRGDLEIATKKKAAVKVAKKESDR